MQGGGHQQQRYRMPRINDKGLCRRPERKQRGRRGTEKSRYTQPRSGRLPPGAEIPSQVKTKKGQVKKKRAGKKKTGWGTPKTNGHLLNPKTTLKIRISGRRERKTWPTKPKKRRRNLWGGGTKENATKRRKSKDY